ncbi:hypothetical protein NLJ89_g1499 [Agrocybe chaxingu]|uniref:GST N-terminal domain-containing protein n=1 Tax=Agrocybe chaxingu TaxID=84603 RepID=A0A9W8MZX5_9AGAR|nr:hypothetical protein NLJ89_g1499 [Agrocybe chaxingu]
MAPASSHTVIGTPFSTFTRTITLGLEYKGVSYVRKAAIPQSALAVENHPFGYLPTLVIHDANNSHGDIKLCESQAIAKYIDRICPAPSLQLQSGVDLPVEEKVWEFVSIVASFGFPAVEVGVVKPRVKATDEGKLSEPKIEVQINEGVQQLKRFLSVVESLMHAEGYAFGGKLTWADFFLYPLLSDLRAVPEWTVVENRLQAWMELMDKLPAVKATENGTLSFRRLYLILSYVFFGLNPISAFALKHLKPRSGSRNMPENTARIGRLKVTNFKGELPKLTILCQTAEDQRRGKLYIYGGIYPPDAVDEEEESESSDTGSEDETPCNDFHVCDVAKMEFTNLTDSLVYTTPADPFSAAGHTRSTKPLPSLHMPGLAFTEIRGVPVVLIFGGYDRDLDEVSSKLIAINTLHLEWFYVTFEPPRNLATIAPRFKPTVVALNERLYIFGGKLAGKRPHLRTYSVAAFQPGTFQWKWVAADEPYPAEVKQAFRNGVVVHGEQAILLGPGRTTDEPINFVSNSFYYFIPRTRTFERLRPSGVRLPRAVEWYYLRAYDPDASQKDVVCQPTVPSAILCAWTKDLKQKGYLDTEGWRFFLPPDEPEHIECLNMKAEVAKLDLNLHRFAIIGKKMFFMGNNGEGEKICDTIVEFSLEE